MQKIENEIMDVNEKNKRKRVQKRKILRIKKHVKKRKTQ